MEAKFTRGALKGVHLAHLGMLFLLQEAFLGGCWEELSSLREMLKEHGFDYSTETVGDSNVIISGGTFIGSYCWFH